MGSSSVETTEVMKMDPVMDLKHKTTKNGIVDSLDYYEEHSHHKNLNHHT